MHESRTPHINNQKAKDLIRYQGINGSNIMLPKIQSTKAADVTGLNRALGVKDEPYSKYITRHN